MTAVLFEPPMNVRPLYLNRVAAAYVRGCASRGGRSGDWLDERLKCNPLGSLRVSDLESVVSQGEAAGLRLDRFKRTLGPPHLQRIFSLLGQVAPDNLLEVGTGRDDFLWRFLEEFPRVSVTAIDRNPRRVADVRVVQAGGLERLSGSSMDGASLQYTDRSFDVVTLLDVLAESVDPGGVIAEARRVARQLVFVSVPLSATGPVKCARHLEQKQLRGWLEQAGCGRFRIAPAWGHLIGVAQVDAE